MAPTSSVTSSSCWVKSMAPLRQAAAHLPQTSFLMPLAMALKRPQLTRSMTGVLGTAWGKGT